MRITEEQERILRSFTCERLSFSEKNKKIINQFKSTRGESLVEYLLQDGWNEDSNGENAFYLIKDESGFPYLYFSLKCGAMFEPLDETNLTEQIDTIQKKIEQLRSSHGNKITSKDVFVMSRILSNMSGMTFEEARTNIILNLYRYKKLQSKRKSIELDRKREEGRPIMRVSRTIPGIELVQFCANDKAKPMWEKLKEEYDFRFPFGEVFFWYFIVPIIEEVQKFVGCQYVFLFAADPTPDETLINYYEVSLKFSKTDDIGTNKPTYDLGCVFMSQAARELIHNKTVFFENFNIDAKDDVI